MIPEYCHDSCVPPSREHSSWWRRLAGPLQCCMPGRETQFDAKMVQKKAFQAILKKYFSCIKAKMFNCPLKVPEQACGIWKLLHWRRWGRSNGEVGSQLLGLSLHGSAEGGDCLDLLWLKAFLFIFWPLPPSADYPRHSLSASRVQETFPVMFCWHLHDRVGRSEEDRSTLPQLVRCLHSTAMCWTNTEW